MAKVGHGSSLKCKWQSAKLGLVLGLGLRVGP
jgi:hypothetical protein